MLKKLVVGVSALVLAGGAFVTAQALTTDGQRLPSVNAPLTVQPAGSQTTSASTTGPSTPATTTGLCSDDDHPNAVDRHGRASDDSSRDRCDDLPTVVPRPSVFTDDHGRHAETEPGDDNGGQGETEPGDDNGGSGSGGDDHSGSSGGGSGDDSGSDHSGSGHSGSGHSGSDGGSDEGGDDHGGRG
jgi:hypothetical protein